MKVAGGTVGGWLHRAERWPELLEAADKVARLTRSQGAQHVVYLPDGDGEVDWSVLTRQASELAQRLKEQHGVTFVFHPHADSYVESQPEIERFLDHTDPESVLLCLDTATSPTGRGDSCDLVRCADRIGYVHLKQVDPKSWTRSRPRVELRQAVPRGICPEPPGGTPSFETCSILPPTGPDLFTVREQDSTVRARRPTANCQAHTRVPEPLRLRRVSVRVGVIGAGTIGQDHIRRLSRSLSNVRVVGIADVDRVRAQSVANTVTGAQVYPTGADLIASPDVDGVVVATWGLAHEEFVLASIACDKPVFCEKPLAPTTDACRRIVDAEIAHGKRMVQVGFMRRCDPSYVSMKAALATGTIGATLLIHCAHRGPSAPPNFTSDMLITDSAIHGIDLVRWLLDEEIVAGTVLRPRRSSRGRTDLQDPMVVLLETESGVLVDVELFVNAEYGYDIRCEVVGEVGTVALGDTAEVVVRHAGQRAGQVPGHWIERFVVAYDVEMQAWIDSVPTGQAVGPSSWEHAAPSPRRASLTDPREEGPVFYGEARVLH